VTRSCSNTAWKEETVSTFSTTSPPSAAPPTVHCPLLVGPFCQHRQGRFRENSGNIQGTFREHSGKIQGTFREHSGTILALYWPNLPGRFCCHHVPQIRWLCTPHAYPLPLCTFHKTRAQDAQQGGAGRGHLHHNPHSCIAQVVLVQPYQ
jgi:hypothetical protein